VSDIAVGGGREFAVGGVIITVWNVDGLFYATDARCPHEDAPLCMGDVQDGVVMCPMHGWQFNVTTGAGVKPPHVHLRSFPVTVVGSDIFVEL
jgi:nitrite reductase/ring-hydroxylating ferredoxin subunit